jgi:hypothetical protein
VCATRRFSFAVFFGAVVFALPGALGRRPPQNPAPPASAPQSVYIAAFRASGHVDRSSPEVFHQAVDGVLEFLKSKNVVLASDPSRPMIQTETTMPRETLLNIARDAGASYLLILTVERPVTSWLKVQFECFDLAGTALWEEHATYGGGINGKNAVPKTLEKIRKQLEARIGQPGLPVEKSGKAADEKPK